MYKLKWMDHSDSHPRDPALVCADRLQQMLLCYNHHDDDADVMPLRWLSVEFSLGLWSFTRWEKSALLVSLLWTANREEKTADIAEMSHKFGWWSSSRLGDEAYCVCVDSARSLGWAWADEILQHRGVPLALWIHFWVTFLLQTSFYKKLLKCGQCIGVQMCESDWWVMWEWVRGVCLVGLLPCWPVRPLCADWWCALCLSGGHLVCLGGEMPVPMCV